MKDKMKDKIKDKFKVNLFIFVGWYLIKVSAIPFILSIFLGFNTCNNDSSSSSRYNLCDLAKGTYLVTTVIMVTGGAFLGTGFLDSLINALFQDIPQDSLGKKSEN